MVDVVRGVLRVRKWPKKRGTPQSAKQRFWVDWFRQANLLAKYADPILQARAIEMTKHTGLYPRDIILSSMRGRLYTWIDTTGWKWFPMAAIQDISESLDVLAQTVGDVLVRAADRWRAPVPGSLGDVLTLAGAPPVPAWQAGGGGGGITQEVIAGTPIVPDGTKNSYDIDVSIYASFQIDFWEVGFASSDQPWFRLSTDGGVTFNAGGSDYRQGYLSPAIDAWTWAAQIFAILGDSTFNQNVVGNFTSLRAGRPSWHIGGSNANGAMAFRAGHTNFDGPVTDIRIGSYGGANYNAGTIRMVGQR